MDHPSLVSTRRWLSARIAAAVLCAAALTALFDAACSGDHAPGPSAVPSAQSAVAGVQPPDSDGDGVVDSQDRCPTEAEDQRWSEVADGCPDGLDDLLALARKDIDAFWKQQLAAVRAPYTSPTDFVPYDGPVETPCGESVPENAFYCAADNELYYHHAFLQDQLDQVGDFGPVFILAHEWGHLVQADLDILADPRRFTIQNELQADCFAGVYTKSADDRQLLEEGDLDEAVRSLLAAGDPRGVPWFSPEAHGSPQQRVAAFATGFERGFQACLSI